MSYSQEKEKEKANHISRQISPDLKGAKCMRSTAAVQ